MEQICMMFSTGDTDLDQGASLAQLMELAKAIGYGGSNRYEDYGHTTKMIKSMSLHEKGLVTLVDSYGSEVLVPVPFLITLGVQLDIALNFTTEADFDIEGKMRGGSTIQYDPGCYVVTQMMIHEDGSSYTTIMTVKEGEPSDVFMIEQDEYQTMLSELALITPIEEFWLSEAPHSDDDPYEADTFGRLAEDYLAHRLSEMMDARKIKTISKMAKRIVNRIGDTGVDPTEYVLNAVKDLETNDPHELAEALGVADLVTPESGLTEDDLADPKAQVSPYEVSFNDSGEVPTFKDLPPYLI